MATSDPGSHHTPATGWKIDTEEAAEEVDNLADKIDRLKDKNISMGVTQTETTQSHVLAGHYNTQSGKLAGHNPYAPYQQLSNQPTKSQSEVALTIKSDKPVTVDKAKSGKNTDLNVNVGRLGWSF